MSEKRKMPVRTRTIALSGDWEGWEFEARTNPTMGTLGDLSSGQFERIITGLANTVKGWNFVDEDGQPLPNPAVIKEPTEVIRRLPFDLAVAMANALSNEIATLPGN